MTRTTRAGLACSIALAAGAAMASDKVIASMPIGSVTVPTTIGATVNVPFSGLTEGVKGFGIVGNFTVQTGDFKDGLGPWSLDAEITANAPGGESLFWHPIGGDVSIGDYPLQDGTTGLPEVDGNGTWAFDFTADVSQSNWIFRIDDSTIYLLGDAPDITTQYTAEPRPERPVEPALLHRRRFGSRPGRVPRVRVHRHRVGRLRPDQRARRRGQPLLVHLPGRIRFKPAAQQPLRLRPRQWQLAVRSAAGNVEHQRPAL